MKEDLDYAELLRETEGINRYQEKIIQFAKGQYEKCNAVKPVEQPAGDQEEEKKVPKSDVNRKLFQMEQSHDPGSVLDRFYSLREELLETRTQHNAELAKANYRIGDLASKL